MAKIKNLTRLKNTKEVDPLADLDLANRFAVLFPAYSHWSRTPETSIESDLILIGCKILRKTEPPDPRIICEVPKSWYFKKFSNFTGEGYTDKTYSELIFKVKENKNTGRLITLIDKNYLAKCKNELSHSKEKLDT